VYEQIRPYVFTGLFTALILYFGIQALTGDRGLLLEPTRKATLAERTAELKALTTERKALETRVALLQDAHLSRDLLEERARVVLGYSDPRDYVIRLPEPASRRS
jgi:cell division protein FtsB